MNEFFIKLIAIVYHSFNHFKLAPHRAVSNTTRRIRPSKLGTLQSLFKRLTYNSGSDYKQKKRHLKDAFFKVVNFI